MLRELIELYAIQTREYYEMVCRLGRHREISTELQRNLKEAKRLRALSDETAENLDRYLSGNSTNDTDREPVHHDSPNHVEFGGRESELAGKARLDVGNTGSKPPVARAAKAAAGDWEESFGLDR